MQFKVINVNYKINLFTNGIRLDTFLFKILDICCVKYFFFSFVPKKGDLMLESNVRKSIVCVEVEKGW